MKSLRFSAKVIVVLLIFLLLFATACGSAGPQGTQGQQGPAGPTGPSAGAKIILMSAGAGAVATRPPQNVIGSIKQGQPLFVLGSGFTPGDVVAVVIEDAATKELAPSSENLTEEYDPYLPDYFLGNALVGKDGSFMMRPGTGQIATMGNVLVDQKPGLYTVKAYASAPAFVEEGIIVATAPLVVTAK